MPRNITHQTNLEALRKEAKRLRKAVAANQPEAVARIQSAFPTQGADISLRQAQHTIAREYGFASWAALKQEIEDRNRSHEERVRLFLEKSVHRYGTDPSTGKWGGYEPDRPERGALAARLLARHPEIARQNIHTAVAAHDLDAVRTFLAKDPRLVHDRHPFDGWTPLLHLAYARLPIAAVERHAMPIASMLLDAGADPNTGCFDHTGGFTALTGVIGEGEAGQSPHPLAEPLARLLVERGADPLDGQALYNTSLGADDTFWLDFMWAETEKRGQTARWNDPNPNLIGRTLDYLLGNAIANLHAKRVAWLLAHGADANAVNAYTKLPVVKHAAVAGRLDIVDLLMDHGASAPRLTDAEAFVAAAAQGDLVAVRELAAAHPERLRDPDAMKAAIHRLQPEAVRLLLDLGMPPDIGDVHNYRALHHAADCGAVNIAKLLLDRGAEIDALETRYGGTPLSHANFFRRSETVALLTPLSRNIRALCFAGAIDRVRELVKEDPSLANREDHPGEPALFCLPDDDERALELAELLLSFGANPKARNPLGQTPADAARKRGLDDAADLLDEAD
jgi:ankyrin repeat protein